MKAPVHPPFARHARTAGLLYLGIIVLGVGAEGAIRAGLIDWADAETTGRAIRDRIGLFRLSILFDAGMVAFDVALALLFYRMLRGIDSVLAGIATVLRLIQAALIAAGLGTLLAAARVAETGGSPLPDLSRHAIGYDVGLIFFGLNALVMARLLRGAGAPAPIAIGIAAAGGVYLFGSVTRLVAPGINAMMQPAYLVPLLAESALMLWLLLGASRRRTAGPDA